MGRYIIYLICAFFPFLRIKQCSVSATVEKESESKSNAIKKMHIRANWWNMKKVWVRFMRRQKKSIIIDNCRVLCYTFGASFRYYIGAYNFRLPLDE